MNIQALADFHLLRPGWLLALLPLAGLLWWLARQNPEAGNWSRACDAELLPWLLTGADRRRNRAPLWMVGLGGVLAILALAGPAWEKLEQPVFRAQSALVIAFDLSRSMEATDLNPSRLTRARHKLLDLLERRREGQTALLVYAAQPFVVSPLTDDAATISAQVNSLTPEMMPAQGSRADLAVAKAAELLKQAGLGKGDLLLITDGIHPGEWTAKLPPGLRISLLGVGTEQGAPIPQPGGGFFKDRDGAIVIPRLEEGPLKELAARGGGRYAPLAVDDQDLDWVLAPLADPAPGDGMQSTGLQADQWREEGAWLLLPLLPLAALGFRRGVFLLLLVLLAPLPRPGEAAEGIAWPQRPEWSEWLAGQELWQRPDQQGAKALEQGDAKGAAQSFRNPEWKGVAHYRAGEYEQSLAALSGIDTARGHYNRGNALARLGRLEEALAAYEEALKRDPADADAKANRDLIRERLRQQQPQNQMPPQPEGGESGENKESPQQEGAQPKSDQQKQEQQGEPPKSADQTEAGQEPKSEEEGKSQAEKPGEGEPPEPAKPSASEQANPQPKPDEKESPSSEQEGAAQAPAPKEQAQEEEPPAQGEAVGSAEMDAPTEQERATEQWLRRIPDDPSELWRRKFREQYRRQYKGTTEAQGW